MEWGGFRSYIIVFSFNWGLETIISARIILSSQTLETFSFQSESKDAAAVIIMFNIVLKALDIIRQINGDIIGKRSKNYVKMINFYVVNVKQATQENPC